MTEAYLYFRHRNVTFRWDGEAPAITASGGDANSTELIPLNGVPFDGDTVLGVLRWFQSICLSHVRMREAAGEPIVHRLRHM